MEIFYVWNWAERVFDLRYVRFFSQQSLFTFYMKGKMSWMNRLQQTTDIITMFLNYQLIFTEDVNIRMNSAAGDMLHNHWPHTVPNLMMRNYEQFKSHKMHTICYTI